MDNKNKLDIFEVISENLTNLGGRMGTEFTYPNWKENFYSIEDAKKFALKDYIKNTKNINSKINWKKTDRGFCSGDLMFVMYHINKLEIN